MSGSSNNDERTLWDIPASWTWTTMGDVADVVGGGTPRTSDPANWNPRDVAWITPADLSGNDRQRISRGARSISSKGLNGSSARLLPVNTVLFSSRAPIGYVVIADAPLATNQGFRNFVLRDGVLPEYIYHYLRGNTALAKDLAGGTTFSEISGKNAARIPLALPPYSEQRRIVAVIEEHFTRLDAAVAALERVRANQKRYRAAILKATCEGRLVPTEAELARKENRDYEPANVLVERILKVRRAQWETREMEKLKAQGKSLKNGWWQEKYKDPKEADASELTALPEGWVWASLDSLADLQLGKMLSAKARTHEAGLRYLRNINIRWDRIDLDDLLEMTFSEREIQKYELRPGDILICEGGEPGRAAVWEGQQEGVLFQKALHRVRPEGGGLNPRFLVYHLWADALTGRLRKYFTGSTIHHLTQESLQTYSVALPPRSEQDRIVAEADRQLSLLDNSRRVLLALSRQSDRFRQATLKRAFAGELVSQDPDDEPAGVLLRRIRARRGQGERSPRAASERRVDLRASGK